MNKTIVKKALKIINDAILEINDGNTAHEDFYWWNAVPNIFGYNTDENGNMILYKVDCGK